MNVGVYGFKTKKALKEAIKKGEEVFVYPTSELFFKGFEDGMQVVVVGPDAKYKRNWYATVEVDKTGKITRFVK